MTWTDDDLRSLYQKATVAASPDRSGCLTPEAMGRLAAHDADGPERDAAIDHLGACSTCAREYRAAVTLGVVVERDAAPQAGPAGGPGSGRDTGRIGPLRWLALAALIVATVALAVGLGRERRLETARVARLTDALAARETEMAEARAAAAENADQIADLRRTVETLSRPEANVPIIDLLPAGVLRGHDSGRLTRIDFPPGAEHATLVLSVTGHVAHDAYTLRIEDSTGAIVWNGGDLRRSAHDTFTLSLPRSIVPPGDYRVRLLGVRAGREETIQTYAVRVRHID